MGRETLVVEFLGLPGSGKSTVSRRVAATLHAKGWKVEQPSFSLAHHGPWIAKLVRKSMRVIAEAIGHPMDSVNASRLIGSVPHPSGFVRLKMTFNWLLVCRLMRRAHGRPGIQLIDQGPLQGLWSIGFGSGERIVEQIGAPLCSRIPAADLVAIIDAADGSIEERLRRRPEMDSRMDHIGAIDPSLMRRCRAALDGARRVAANGAETAARCLTVRNESRRDLDQAADRIAARIMDLMDPDDVGAVP